MDSETAAELVADHKARMNRLEDEQRRRAHRAEAMIFIMMATTLIVAAAVVYRLVATAGCS
jgi:uncharacterized membrane protein YidH (DUF202 family)